MSEQIVWTGRPSHILNFSTYFWCILFCWLVIPVIVMLVRMIQLKSTSYELTTERLKIRTGVFNRQLDELELYRVKDYRLEQPFFLRLMGRSNVLIYTSDATDRKVALHAISGGDQLREKIRTLVEARRTNRRVSEVDMANI